MDKQDKQKKKKSGICIHVYTYTYMYRFKVKFYLLFLDSEAWETRRGEGEWKKQNSSPLPPKKRERETDERKESEALVVFVINFVRRGSVKVFQAMDECDSSHDQIYMIPECTRPTIRICDYVQREMPRNLKSIQVKLNIGGALQVAYTALEWKLNSCISYSSSFRFCNSEDAMSLKMHVNSMTIIQWNHYIFRYFFFSSKQSCCSGWSHLDVRWQMNMAFICLRTTASFVPLRSATHHDFLGGISSCFKISQSNTVVREWVSNSSNCTTECLQFPLLFAFLYLYQRIDTHDRNIFF